MARLTPESCSPPARSKLLEVALRILREKGYNATTVDELCAGADVTKGAFFHHFKSKEDMAVAAADHWSAVTGELFTQAAYHDGSDPLDRVLGYIDLRASLSRSAPAEFSCVAGTMTHETFLSHPAIRRACSASIIGHAGTLEEDLAEAIDKYQPLSGLTAHGLAIHIQAVLHGAFILAKAPDDPQIAVDSTLHLRRYFELLFASKPAEGHSHAT
jgi:TetR/AcrR family transcriptional regulator, transcriptional repressor for nem operon